MVNFEASTTSSTMIQDLEELDYMGEREGRDVIGREIFSEVSVEDHVSIHTFFRFFESNYTFSCVMFKTYHFTVY